MSVPLVRVIRRAALAAPREHGGVLIEPPPGAIARFCRAAPPDAPILDSTLAALRRSLRRRLGLGERVVATGHQAEFFHAGVFAKTLAAAEWARRCSADGVFLLVDCDLPKSDRVRTCPHDGGGLSVREIALPGLDAQRTLECQPPANAQRWGAFFDAIAGVAGPDAALSEFREAFLSSVSHAGDLVDAFGAGEAAVRSALGVQPLRQVRMSALAQTPEFRALVAWWLLHAERMAGLYNAAQHSYRRRNRVRNRQRPVPPLTIADDRVETPLWVYRSDGLRRRLFVRSRGAALELLADETTIGSLDASGAGRSESHEQPWQIERDGWRVRPRALLLSAAARLLLGDLFIHGIGGAKYDEMTEEFVAGGLGCQPGAMACVSGTLRLARQGAWLRPQDVREALRRVRDFEYNPQRYVRLAPAALLAERDRCVAAIAALERQREPGRRARQLPHWATRREAWLALRIALDAICAVEPQRRDELRSQAGELRRRAALERLADDREAFFALHARSELAALRDRLCDALGDAPCDWRQSAISPSSS